MAREGRLARDGLVSKSATGPWHRAEQVRGLFDATRPIAELQAIPPPLPVEITNAPPVVTIQKTSKKWKALTLLGLGLTFGGMGGCAVLSPLVGNARASDGMGAISWIATLMMVACFLAGLAGPVVVIVSRVGAWWEHG